MQFYIYSSLPWSKPLCGRPPKVPFWVSLTEVPGIPGLWEANISNLGEIMWIGAVNGVPVLVRDAPAVRAVYDLKRPVYPALELMEKDAE